MEHGAKTDSDLARPPGGDHPATQQASPSVSTRGAARRGQTTAKHTYSSSTNISDPASAYVYVLKMAFYIACI
jgi:hypothetical protein